MRGGSVNLADEWHSAGNRSYSAEVALDGKRQLVVEYYEQSGDAEVQFWWERIGSLP